MQHCAIVKGWALHTRSRLHSIATPPPTHTCTPLCRQYSRTPLLHCATYIQEQISVFSIQNEHDSFGPEPCTDPKQNGLPYDAERTLRAYSLFLLFLQFQYSLSNGCIDALLKATHAFIQNIAKASVDNTLLVSLAQYFPSSLRRLKSGLQFPEAKFQEYAVCPTCGWIYNADTCRESHDTPFLCNNTQFPNHPHQSRAQLCGTPLSKVVHTRNGRNEVKLVQTLCYNPISDQLARILQRFNTELNQSFDDIHDQTVLFDIDDGPVYKSRLAMLNSRKCLDQICLVLNVNVDWFQPYKRVQHSVGAIYASISNLPRQVRYQMENMLLVSVIPGPAEPVQMNSILVLLVDELKELRQGKSVDGIFIKAAIQCLACDLPAARKTGGFASHSSTHGCTRCLKTFPYSKDMNKVDTSGWCCPRIDPD